MKVKKIMVCNTCKNNVRYELLIFGVDDAVCRRCDDNVYRCRCWWRLVTIADDGSKRINWLRRDFYVDYTLLPTPCLSLSSLSLFLYLFFIYMKQGIPVHVRISKYVYMCGVWWMVVYSVKRATMPRT